MIDLATLKEIGKLKGLTNLGHMEKDYVQEVLLLLIYRNFDFLAFKGGTCLYKFHRLDRFSEDLDFSATKEFDLEVFTSALTAGLERFGLPVQDVSRKRVRDTVLLRLRVRAQLYSGAPTGLCTIRLDINTTSDVLQPKTLTLRPLYPDIPSFEVLALSKEELLAEKVRAIMTRTKARDVYDLWFLLKETKIDLGLVRKKLDYYALAYSPAAFRQRVDKTQDLWEKGLSSLVRAVPRFIEVRRAVLDAFSAAAGNRPGE